MQIPGEPGFQMPSSWVHAPSPSKGPSEHTHHGSKTVPPLGVKGCDTVGEDLSFKKQLREKSYTTGLSNTLKSEIPKFKWKR